MPVNRGPKQQAFVVPAPVGGWNTRDPLSNMDPRFAVTLDNWFPNQAEVRLRRGHAEHKSGLTGSFETLPIYTAATSSKMFGIRGGSIYDATSAGSFGAALVSGLTNSRWQWVNFGTSGGQFLVMVNGADDPRIYDGSTWGTTPAVTGVTPSSLVHLCVHQRRIFFVEKNKLKFWYLSVDSVGGGASGFEIGSLCPRGGYLQAIGSWTRDGGSGPDDILVLVTSEGDVVLYSGTDPSDATAWTLVGRFQIAKPIGRRCLLNVGGDLLVLTVDGVIPLSVLLSGKDEAQLAELSLTKTIARAVSDAAVTHGSKFGWEMVTYRAGNMLIVNVPTGENATAQQFVMNLQTGAWCRFTGLNANAWVEYQGNLYFGANDGAVYQADTGESDNGSDITGDCKPAFNYMGNPALRKTFLEARPILSASGVALYAMQFCVDFEDRAPSTVPSSTQAAGTAWDDGAWDTFAWADGERIVRSATSVSGEGYAASPRIQVATRNMTIALQMINVLFEAGAPV